ncbi:hypothetical protein AAG906_027314 [Vitis piasezkii]
MGKLQIEERRQQEENGEDPKKEESPLVLPLHQQMQGESSQDLPNEWKFVTNHPQDEIIGNPSSGCMHSEFEMSMMGELNFFLELQIKQLKEETFINQAKYIRDLLKSSSIKIDKDEKASSPLLHSFSWLLDESRLPLGHKASAQLSHLSQRMTYGIGGPIISTARGVKIRLDSESICHIFDIALIGLRVYKSKIWSTMPGFEPREVVQRFCGLADAQGMGKPSAHNLTMISRVLHHMICSILLPRGGYRDEVSYYEAFLVDSILTGRRIHLGYFMMMHMISCCESTTRVLPYGRFLTRVFKDADIDLSRETNFEAPSAYDTYDDQSMGQMKFEKATDGSWGQGQVHPRVDEEAEMEGGPHHTEIPPHQALLALDHAPWMDLSAQISSLGTCMEELPVISDSRLASPLDLSILRITWINIRLPSPHSLSISSRGLSALRITWRVSMRR